MLIKCYTDGSACVKGINKGKGGFATYFPNLISKRKVYSLGFTNTKTGRMEITALLYAIKAIPPKLSCTLKVFSDSEYVVKSFTEKRLNKWVFNNWKSVSWDGSIIDIKNVDLWKKILYELSIRENMILKMEHIRSHQLNKIKCEETKKELLKDENVKGNYIADKFASYKRFTKFKTDKY